MPNERFLRRWSRLKAQGGATDEVPAPVPLRPELQPLAQTTPHPPVSGPVAAPTQATPSPSLPTFEDAARLTTDSDFSAFVTQGVDKAVQRLAMKKLFSDPHFNLMDGLDIYIDDYNKFDPISAAMLASLEHARSLFPREVNDEQAAKDKDEPGPQRQPDDEPPPQSAQGDA